MNGQLLKGQRALFTFYFLGQQAMAVADWSNYSDYIHCSALERELHSLFLARIALMES